MADEVHTPANLINAQIAKFALMSLPQELFQQTLAEACEEYGMVYGDLDYQRPEFYQREQVFAPEGHRRQEGKPNLRLIKDDS